MKPKILKKDSKTITVKPLKKKPHISPSQINNGQCLFKYKMINLLGKIKVGNVHMSYGSMVHQVIYEYTKRCVEDRLDGDFEVMAGLIDSNFKKYKLPEDLYGEARQNLLQFAEIGFNTDTILGYEQKFVVNIGMGVKVKGIIDRVNSYQTEEGTVLEIIDYKNQMNIMTKSDVESLIQLQIYKYLGAEFLYKGYDFVRVGIYHTRYNFIRWGSMTRVIDCGQEFENTDKLLTRQWDRLILTPDDKYLPEVGAACWEYQGCPVMLAGLCPKFTKAAVEKMKLGTRDDKVRALRKLDIDRKELIVDLKEFYKISPPEKVDGGSVGFVGKESYSYELDGLSKFAESNKISLAGISISKTAAETAIKKVVKMKDLEDEAVRALNECKIENASTRFAY